MKKWFFKKEWSHFEVISLLIVSTLTRCVSWWFLLLYIPVFVIQNKMENTLNKDGLK